MTLPNELHPGFLASAGGSGDLGDTIEQSLRFNGSSYLDFTPSTGGDATEGTFSAWVKKASTTSLMYLFSSSLDTDTANTVELVAYADNEIRMFDKHSGSTRWTIDTSAVYRDPSSWYHVLYVKDTSNATSTDRIKLFINGVRVTNFSSSTFPSSGVNGVIGSANAHRIGGRAPGAAASPLEGYMAEVHYLDGISVTDAEDFGRYNEDGVWVPKNYTGSYGTNGFHLTFDSSQTNGIGHDSSGNGNHFTATGFDTTAISSSNPDNDIDFNDTPTSNYATLNPLFNAADHTPRYFGITKDANLAADTSGGQADWATTSNIELPDGKWYFEVTYTTRALVGIAGGDDRQNNRAFIEAHTGNYTTQNSFGTSGPTSNSGSQTSGTIGCRVDITNRTLAFTWDGSTYTSNLTYSDPGHKIFPYISAGAQQPTNNTIQINHGQMPFIYSVPTGFEGNLQTNNLPEPTIKNGKDHFDVVTYTGNGSTQSITGLEFQPDFVWLKSRNVGYHHRLFDVIRGQSSLVSDDARAEGTSADSSLTSFDSNGFSITQTTNESYNQSTNTYVAWCWKAGGTAVSNSDGDITSSVSANTDAGFSIVKYTGNTGDDSVGHGLTQAPEVVFTKPLNASAWVCYFEVLGRNTWLNLNLDTSASGNITDYWGPSSSWTNTTMGVYSGGDGNNNLNGIDTVAYCWHSVEGFSKFGSYTGNGSTDGPFIYTGMRSAFVMIKRADSAGNWYMWDSTRDPYNPCFHHLFADVTNAENTNSGHSNQIDILSNGFKLRRSGGNTNASGATYIYISFAESPFGGENAPPATAR